MAAKKQFSSELWLIETTFWHFSFSKSGKFRRDWCSDSQKSGNSTHTYAHSYSPDVCILGLSVHIQNMHVR